ncbi:hypothetical protein AGMMS50293_14490 [Spirochaetia bacterium]|nr:hypothetical protein AGMMS50293_14490 [Spirochaetia bacterium]
MAIQPIDLQALFSQVDKVGKAQSALREGLAVQQAIQGAQLQRKTEEHIQEVNEAQDSGDGAEKVNDRGRRRGGGGKDKKRAEAEEAENEEQKPVFFSDPSLGKNIDISL